MSRERPVYSAGAKKSNASLSLSFPPSDSATDTVQNNSLPSNFHSGDSDSVDRLLSLCREMWDERLFDTQAALSAAESLERQSRAFVDAAVPDAKRALAQTLNLIADCAWRVSDFERADRTAREARLLSAELGDTAGEAQALNSIGLTHYFLGAYSQARSAHERSLKLRRAIQDRTGECQSLNNIGAVCKVSGDLSGAMNFFTEALAIQREIGNSSVTVQTLTNIGTVAYAQGNFGNALKAFRQSLELAESLSQTTGQMTALSNIGAVQTDLGDYPGALESLSTALRLAQTLGDRVLEANALTNIGLLQLKIGDSAKALATHQQCLELQRFIGNKSGEAVTLYHLGDTYRQMQHSPQAIECLMKALHFAESSGDKPLEAHCLTRLGQLYKSTGDYPNALARLQHCLELNRELGSKANAAECLIALGELYLDDSFTQFTVGDAALSFAEALALAEDTGAKEAVCRSLFSLYTVSKQQGNTALALDYHERFYNAEREVFSQENRKKMTLIEVQYQTDLMHREQELTDKLLENILPVPIIRRLKQGAKTIAERVPEATVLFSDIVHFTQLAAKTPPQQLVEWLNQLFSLFDSLVERNGLEKIKTIGDAYMVVGGLPEPRPDHAEAAAQLALEMLAALKKFNAKHDLGIDLRIGIHTGEVVAGVIGTKKLAYDLWGDTVNIAWRMQTHSIDGTIQVTDEVCRRLHGKFMLKERGQQEVKGKGLMTTYFLTGKAHPH